MVKYKLEEAANRKWVKVQEKMLLSKALLPGEGWRTQNTDKKKNPALEVTRRQERSTAPRL